MDRAVVFCIVDSHMSRVLNSQQLYCCLRLESKCQHSHTVMSVLLLTRNIAVTETHAIGVSVDLLASAVVPFIPPCAGINSK